MSTIKLPALPPMPTERYVGLKQFTNWDMQDYATAYAEEAVRQALAAQVPVAACLLGYGSTILTTDTERIHDGWKGLAVIPENSDG